MLHVEVWGLMENRCHKLCSPLSRRLLMLSCMRMAANQLQLTASLGPVMLVVANTQHTLCADQHDHVQAAHGRWLQRRGPSRISATARVLMSSQHRCRWQLQSSWAIARLQAHDLISTDMSTLWKRNEKKEIKPTRGLAT